MNVRISYTVDVSDEYRRAVRRYYGDTGMATSKELREWFEVHGRSEDDNLKMRRLAESDWGAINL